MFMDATKLLVVHAETLRLGRFKSECGHVIFAISAREPYL